MKNILSNLINHKNTTRRSRAGSGLNLLKGCTLMLVMALIVIGCDSIVDQNTEADAGIATSDISGVLSVVEGTVIECIDPDAGEYNIATDSQTIEWGNKKNPFSKTVDIEYYNTLTEFVLRVKSTEMIADVLVDDESIKDFDGTVEAGTWQEFRFDLDEGDTQTFSLKIAGSGPAAEFEVNYTLLGECDSERDTTTEVVDVTNPITGKTWMDRNLGASRAATNSFDPEAYGDLYQWGRAADGHQKRNSGTTTTLSNTDQPDHGDFIKTDSNPYDWRSPQNSTLWQGVDGTNNPCPSGYRIPTAAEWDAERLSWGTTNQNAAGAFASPLKLPLAGARSFFSGSLDDVGSYGYYWSGTADSYTVLDLVFDSGNAGSGPWYRARGRSVRCIKE